MESRKTPSAATLDVVLLQGAANAQLISDPTFELTQFAVTLSVANEWRVRLGQPKNDTWAEMVAKLAPAPLTPAPATAPFAGNRAKDETAGGTGDGTAGGAGDGTRDGTADGAADGAADGGAYLAPMVYNQNAACTGAYTSGAHLCEGRTSHPAVLLALGMLPGLQHGIDAATMNRTLDEVLKTWDFTSAWGWDFGLMAMTSARLGRTDAVDILMMDTPKNAYVPPTLTLVEQWGKTSDFVCLIAATPRRV